MLLIFLVAALVLVAGPASPQNQAADEAAIRDRVAAMETALNAGDYAGVAALYAPDGDVMIVDGPIVSGRAAIQADAEADWGAAPERRIALTVTSLRFLGPDVAIVNTRAELNEGAWEDRGTWVMVRRGGEWLLAALRVLPALASPEADLDAIAEARSRLTRALKADALDGIFGSLTEDHLTMPQGEPAPPTLAALSAWHERRIATYSMDADWRSQELMLAGNWALDRWTAEVALTPRTGGPAVKDVLKGLWVWQRTSDGSWKLARSIWNSDKPAPTGDQE